MCYNNINCIGYFISIELNVIPNAATAHITPNNTQPRTGLSALNDDNVMGVYVPAMSKNIEQWSIT